LEAEEAIQELRHYNAKQDLAVTLAFLAGAYVLTGNNNKAITASDEALQLAIELEDKLIFGQILTATSRVEAFGKGDISKAYSMLEEATKVLKEHGPRWSYGIALYSIGNLAINMKKFDVARVNLKTARHVMQELGSMRNVSMIKSELAHILRYEGNYIEAIPAYQETIREWQRMGHRSAVAHQLECMAFIAKAREQTEKSTRLLGAAEALRERIEINMTPQELKEYEAEIADLKANMDAKEFESLWAEGRSMTMEEAIELASS
jgi:tetratricopeptide (TPR) repeat protein